MKEFETNQTVPAFSVGGGKLTLDLGVTPKGGHYFATLFVGGKQSKMIIDTGSHELLFKVKPPTSHDSAGISVADRKLLDGKNKRKL